MTKSARIPASFLILVSLFVLFSAKSEAFDLLNPGELSANPQLTTNNQQPAIYTPSVTFGQLLDGSYRQVKEEKQKEKELADAAKIKDLLSKLEESYRESINNNPITQSSNNPINTNDVSDPQLLTDNLQLITNNQPPTPTSSVSNLIANISSLINSESINNQQSTTNNLQLNLGNPKKSWFTIALLGDSMTDTLGPDLPHLSGLLKDAYPDYTFNLLNYGQGATDITSGLYRLTNTTNYLGKEYPPLLSKIPDILVVESFAYNPRSWEKYDLDNQWLTIARIIDTVKANSPDTKIILASAIAPNTKIFGDGSLNWNGNDKWKKATTIRLYLQNMVNFATSENYPLADAYHPSLDNLGEGQEKYINGGDHLHPSEEGKQLFSQKIMEAIKQHNLIK